MSSDSRPSIRGYFKDKIKKVIKSNITSSIRERLISNETYHDVRDKYHNLTDNAKDRTGLGKLLNKTKGFLPDVFSSNENKTIRKGFYDTLFSSEIEEDVYVRVAVICLWIIAILCIIPTIITLFIPSTKKPTKTIGVKMIFFHIFLCELFYLIYILLAMINVAQKFQMNTVFCNVANYGMYITIPVMHFALLFLSIERITKFCQATTTWTKIFLKPYIIQLILFSIWLIFTAIMVTIILFKDKFSLRSIASQAGDIAPPIFQKLGKKISSPYRCSIDGRLSSLFKILLIILFIILIVLIVKSLIVAIFYNFFTPSCCQSKDQKKKKYENFHITILYVIFLLLNLFFSFPFYFISMTHNILTRFSLTKDAFTMKLKISFMLRLSSIILQCFAFATIESNAWNLLSRLLYRSTCKKLSVFNNDIVYTRKATTTTKTKHKTTAHADSDNIRTYKRKNEDAVIDDSDNDEVFIDATKNKLLKKKQSGNTIKVSSDKDDTDVEQPVTQKSKKSTEKKEVINNRRQEKDTSEDEEEVPIKQATSKYSNTNGTSKPKSNGNITSQPTSSAPPVSKNSKSNTDRNSTKHQSIHISLSSSDDASNVSVHTDDNIKPSSTISKSQSVTRSSSNDKKRTTTVLTNEHHSHHQRHRSKHSQVSRPKSNSSKNHQHINTTEKRQISSGNVHHRSEKPKKLDHHSKILNDSDDV